MNTTRHSYVRETLGVSALLLASIVATDLWQLDRAIAMRWAFDATQGHFRAHSAFWANGLLHTGGRNLVIGLGVVALCCAMLGLFAPRRFPGLHGQARALLGAVAGMGLTVVVVGAFKHFSNVDCPWSLIEFGGTEPYVGLFGARPAGLPPAAGCFPAAHAATGYALFSFYFAFRQSHPRFGRFALASALLLGASFGFAQQARGAHFLSHDVWSAWLAWMIGITSQRFWRDQRRSATLMPSCGLVQFEMRSSPGR